MSDRINVPDQPGYDYVFKSREGIVGKDLSGRADRVAIAAKRQVGVRTGLLRASIHKEWLRESDLAIRVGSDIAYSYLHHEGTRPHIIRSVRAKALRWVAKDGSIVFAKSVFHPGTHPNRYLLDSLPLAVL